MTQRKSRVWKRGTKKGFAIDGEVVALLDTDGVVCLQVTDTEGRIKTITIAPDQQVKTAEVLGCAIRERNRWGHQKRRS